MSVRRRARSPLPRAALAQLGGLLLALALAPLLGEAVSWGTRVWLIGAAAAALATILRLPPWWLPLELLFAPALYAASHWHVNPFVYLAALLICLLLLGNSLRDRVPLYLSSRKVWERLAGLLPAEARWIDLGCGTGAGLIGIDRLHPRAESVGVESSPLLWLLARLRLRGRARCRVVFADLWAVDLGQFDLVYAFLSPAPMPDLWAKACAEMRPGSLLVSNSFAVPEVPSARVLEVDDRRRSRLYVWEM